VNQDNWQKVKVIFSEALEVPVKERAAFLDQVCGGHTELRDDVESLLSADEEAGEFIVEPALVEAGFTADERVVPDTTVVGRRIGAYQIVRELGRGGMGAVFLAVRADAQFEKQVAIKIVKRGMDTDSILRRFVMERQILANLEHPNIARFLDGGTTEDGLPYFVMEYVNGEPITKHCDAKGLSPDERLMLFQKVCAAVQYAHQNLIVHRDIKPGNILITQEGTPKLLDFGVAKLLNPDWTSDRTEQTASVLRLMTPAYASPEQLRGLPINTATDVYSLGVVLYELLSGQRPFHFSSSLPEEIERVLLNAEPMRPSTAALKSTEAAAERNSGDSESERALRQSVADERVANEQVRFYNPKALRGDLDNIVLKALRKDRERRYASVLEFSEDIHRHLRGLPVTARPDTFSYRAGKFIQRHRAGVAMAVLVAVTLLSATIITSWQAHVARREHAKAELRSAEQRKLASSLISEVQKSLKDVPHSLTAQRLLAQKSLEYLNNLAKDAGDDPQFLGELAAAYQNLGYLQAWTLQDNPNAILSYERAIDLGRRRLAIEPGSVAAKRALGDILTNKIESLDLMQRLEEASETFADKQIIEQELLNEDPQNPVRMMWVAESSQAYGELLRAIKQNEEANAKFQIAVDWASRAVDLFKAQAITPPQRVDLTLMQEKLASMFEQLNELPQAAQNYREAVAVASAVHTEHPEIVQALRNTTSSHWFLGMVLDRLGDHQGALENYRVSLKTILDATAADPSVDLARAGETKYSVVVGRALCKLHQREEGVELIRHGVDLAITLITSDKGNRQNVYYGGELLSWGIDGLAAAGLREEAKTISLKLIGWVEETAQNSPEDGGPRLRLVSLYEQLGDVYAGYDPDARKIGTTERARLIEARRWYQKGLDLLRDTIENFKVSKTSLQDQLSALQEKISECDAQRSEGSIYNGPTSSLRRRSVSAGKR
jgi:serine/threonine protein kinase